MTPTKEFDIMMLGHLARDQIFVDGRGGDAPGGAVYYGSIALSRLGYRVAVVTRLRREDFSLLDELKAAGVQVFATPAAETSGIANYYRSENMERRVTRPLGYAGFIEEEDVPDVSARIYAVTPIMAGEVSLALLKSLARRGPVALDVQGFVRVREGDSLVFKPWPEMAEGLAHVTYLKVDRAEAELLTGSTDLAEAARALAAYGPREIILTQSSGVTVLAEDEMCQAPFTPRSLDGRTGRGDTCFITYLAKRLDHSCKEATRWAAAVTTLKQEKPGPWDGDLAAVERLLAQREKAQAHESD